jgi:adenine specific DNA methylase Mod
MNMTKEQRFYTALQDVFIGAKIEGEGGFVNLMRIKSNYYRKIEDILKQDIETALKNYSKFRDELFDKLYSFFSRYFTESGSIYFNQTPFHNNVYEKVYTDERDVILFWKTQMLYYVKTDSIFRNLPVEFEGLKFYFDASKIENKKANEKRSLIFELDKVREDGTIVFGVSYSEKGIKTKQDEILKAIKKKGLAIAEEQLERAFRVFEKQSEVDFFINKNAKAFLQEQFKLWSYQYFWEGAKEWSADRVNQLQILKGLAFKIIDFISQFEDELVKIWNKPKFVKNSNYVITLDRITDKKLVEKIKNHTNYPQQVKELKELGIDKDNPKAPIDTKYFKDLELEILNQFEDLDKSLDGWLIKSENYQALSTILPKFKERVKAIYIDPPYNTDASEIIYLNRYKDSSWLSLINDRINLGAQFLSKEGIYCITIDDFEYSKLREILGSQYIQENILGVVAIKNNPAGRSTERGFSIAHEYAIFFTKSEKSRIGRLERNEEQKARYKEQDNEGPFEWVNFRKHGAIREESPKMFYPIFIGERTIRIPKVNWNAEDQEWIALEAPTKEEITIYPIDEDGFERRWKWGIDRAMKEINEMKVEKDRNGELAVYIKSRPHEEGMLPSTWWDRKEYSATDYGTALLKNLFGKLRVFSYPKSIYAVADSLRVMNVNDEDIVLDFFAGSGTTAQAVIYLNKLDTKKRKYILVEMAAYFDSVILPRIKKLCISDKWRRGKPQKDGRGTSQFIKYYELEQYDETLENCKYEDGNLFNVHGRSPYQEYIFMKDEKMLKALEINYEKVKMKLATLYPNIDIAETLSNLTGKWLKKINDNEVEFEDGTKINTRDLNYKLIKPLIWW